MNPPESDPLRGALKYAFRLLARRSRTAAEMSQRLRRKGFSEPVAGRCVQRLLDEGLLDDESFAREYMDYSREHRPMGRIRLRHELRRRGVDDGLIERVLADLTEEDEEIMARRLLRRRGGIPDEDLPFEQRQRQMRRLFSYLARRGFSGSLIRRLLRRGS